MAEPQSVLKMSVQPRQRPVPEKHVETVIHKGGKIRTRTRREHRNPEDITPKQEVIAATYATELVTKPAGAFTRTARKLGTTPQNVKRTVEIPKVDEVVTQHLNAVLKDADITRERIIEELGTVAFFNVQDLFDDNGNMMHPSMWPEHAARAIQGMDVERRVIKGKDGASDEEEIVLKPRAASKIQALEILGRIKIPELRRQELTGRGGTPLIPTRPEAVDKELYELLLEMKK
jgi:terminase small subunit-like protein